MIYLSRILVDRSVAAKRELTGLYEWHRFSWEMFPQKRKDDKRDFLTRVDADEDGFKLTILSFSKPERPEWCKHEDWKEKELSESFFHHGRFLFKVMVNPTKTLSNRDPQGNKKNNGSHYAITKRPELGQWLLKKAEQNGFRLLDRPEIEISPPIFHKFRRKGDEGVIVGVEFKGGLEVTDKAKFLEAVTGGIGRARGMGFGMLVLRPIS
jgi:CRISPR system Cascade subunit CasE